MKPGSPYLDHVCNLLLLKQLPQACFVSNYGPKCPRNIMHSQETSALRAAVVQYSLLDAQACLLTLSVTGATNRRHCLPACRNLSSSSSCPSELNFTIRRYCKPESPLGICDNCDIFEAVSICPRRRCEASVCCQGCCVVTVRARTA